MKHLNTGKDILGGQVCDSKLLTALATPWQRGQLGYGLGTWK